MDRSLLSRMPKESASLKRGANHLFVVGIDDYQEVAKLNNPVRDAEAVRDLLMERYRFQADHLYELYNQQATRRNIMNGLRGLITKLQPEDSLIIYFSGHGHYDQLLDEGYWVPVDATHQNVDNYIPYTFIQQVVRKIPARHILLLVDSCYSGAVLVRGERDLVKERLERDPSRWIIASGRNEVVVDQSQLNERHSPFADALLELLGNYSQEGLTTLRLIDRLTENVSYNAKQTPIGQALQGVGHKGGQFVFYPRKNEARDWAEAKSLATSEAYQRFLKAYPQSRHADEAHWQIACLRNSKAAYRSYRHQQAQGQYRLQASEKILAIEDRERFEQAKRRGEGALGIFIETYPDSAYREQARAELLRLEQGREPEAWREAQAADNLQALQTYLQNFPDGAHAEEARRRWAAKEAEAATQQALEEERKRQEEERRKAEQRRQADEARQAEAKRLAEEKRKQEAARKAEAERQRKSEKDTLVDSQPETRNPKLLRYGLIGLPLLLLLVWGVSQIRDKGPTKAEVVDPKELPIPKMKRVAGGSFQMGDGGTQDDEKPAHKVKLSSFEIGVYEVTQREWQAVMGSNPSSFKCPDCPVETVSWEDVQKYIRKLNQLTGSNFRLPTEAEWEYAARGGSRQDPYTYAGSNNLSSYGWYADNSGSKTHPVGQKRPNGLGLYDMSGNVWEWCSDWYDSDYYSTCKSQGTVSNPSGPKSGSRRVLRGGGWYGFAFGCRVAVRSVSSPDDRFSYFGFRLARTP